MGATVEPVSALRVAASFACRCRPRLARPCLVRPSRPVPFAFGRLKDFVCLFTKDTDGQGWVLFSILDTYFVCI